MTERNPADLGPLCIGDSGPRPKIVLWGDSHAAQFATAVSAGLSGKNFRLAARAGCVPLLGVTPKRHGVASKQCKAFNQAIFAAIEEDSSIHTVILAGRWARFAFPETNGEAQRLDGGTRESALAITIAALRKSGRRVIVIGSVPEFKDRLPRCLARATWRHLGEGTCRFEPATLPGADRWMEGIRGATILHPSDILCPAGVCRRTFEGSPVSSDTDHLTAAAARAVIDRMRLDL